MGRRRNFFIILILSILWPSSAFSLEKPTHWSLNRYIAQNTINNFSLNNYLIKKLGFEKGIDEKLLYEGVDNEIWRWIAQGGMNEDEPDGLIRIFLNMGRSNNHFHNPLKTWDKAGLDVFLFSGQSSIIWAQNPNQDPGGKYSWQDAREYFYEGLTSATKSARDAAFANTFKSLGQLMHIVEDASVPAHVRNDVHIFYNYEKWLEKIRTQGGEGGKFIEFIANPIAFDWGILNGPANPLAPIPIAKIIDTDQYDGSNPPVASGNTPGIAEYTNANFFSEDTIFSKAFPYPSLTSVQKVDYSIPDPRDKTKAVTRPYFEKIGDGEMGYRLAAVSFLEEYTTEYLSLYGDMEIFSLDEQVYGDYAAKLLPRAVGYAAGLLYYFFRGRLEIIPMESENVRIKNLSSEDMEGNIAFYYDAADGTRKPVPDGSWFISLAAGGISNPLKLAEPNDIGESGQYILVFNGRMGRESGAVAGQIWSRKYHWAIVVDYPPLWQDRYTLERTKIDGTYWDCGTIVGAEYEHTVTDHCPGAGFIKVYLLASERPLQSGNIYNQCSGNFRFQYIGQFNRADLFSKIFYQTIGAEIYWRQVQDINRVYICPLKTGKIAYAIDVYNIPMKNSLRSFSWMEILVDSPEITQIKNNLFPGMTVISAFKSNNFNENDYGWTFSEESFSYAVSDFLGGFMEICNQDDSAACYCWSKCDSSCNPICFNVVGIIPDSGPIAKTKGVKITMPDGLEFVPFYHIIRSTFYYNLD